MGKSGRDFICPKVIGGLGNQLFVLMAAYALAKEEKTEFVIDPRNYAACPGRRVNIYWDTFLKNLRPFVQWGRRPKKDNMIKEAQGYVCRKIVRKQKGRTQLKGYFQSYKYFDKYRTEIQSFFELDPTTYNYLNNKYKWLDLRSSKLYMPSGSLDVAAVLPATLPSIKPLLRPARVIAIHVRRGDYVLKGHYVLPITYYQKCLDYIKDEVINELQSGRPIIAAIFSDDSKWCESVLLPIIKSYFCQNVCLNDTNVPENPKIETDSLQPVSLFQAFVVTGEKDYIELHMLQYCDIYFLANSTFSWWGAYLNRKKDIQVFMPFCWMTPNHPCPSELVYPGWKVVRY